jgi:hypothetical protein
MEMSVEVVKASSGESAVRSPEIEKAIHDLMARQRLKFIVFFPHLVRIVKTKVAASGNF